MHFSYLSGTFTDCIICRFITIGDIIIYIYKIIYKNLHFRDSRPLWHSRYSSHALSDPGFDSWQGRKFNFSLESELWDGVAEPKSIISALKYTLVKSQIHPTAFVGKIHVMLTTIHRMGILTMAAPLVLSYKSRLMSYQVPPSLFLAPHSS